MNNEQEMQMLRETERGTKAAAVLKNPIYLEAVVKVEQMIVEQWKNAPIRDVEGQTYLRLMLKALRDVTGHIKSVAETGRLAEQQMAVERGLVERAKAAVREFRRVA